MLHDLVRRVERIEALDRLARPLVKVISPAVRPRAVRNLLSGTYVGHPLHPMLTDLPIGAWGMSAVLDAVGGPAAEPAADLLVKVGVAAAVPTAASGLNDWSDTYGRETRAGLVHAMAMTTALSLYAASTVQSGSTADSPASCPARTASPRAPVARVMALDGMQPQ
jgi:hypothetical protein